MSRRGATVSAASRICVWALVLGFEVAIAVAIGLGYGFLALAGTAAAGVLLAALFVPVRTTLLVYVAVVALVPDVLGVAVGGLALTASRALAVALLVIVGARVLVGWETPRRSPLDWAIAIFATLLVVGASLSVLGADTMAARYGIVRLSAFIIEYFGMYFVVLWTVRGAAQRERLVLVVVAVMVVAAAYGLLESASGQNLLNRVDTGFSSTNVVRHVFTRADLTRARSTFEHPISLGTTLAMALPLGLWAAAFARTVLGRLASYGASLLMAGALVLTLSRGSYIAALVALVVVLAFSGRTSLRARAAFFSCGAGVVALLFGQRLLEPISSMFAVDASISTRLVDYPAVWSVFLAHPLFGQGLGSLNPFSFAYVDNYFLKTIGEMGVAGILALVLLFVLVLGKLSSNVAGRPPGRERGLATALLAAACAFAFQTATFDSFSFSKPATLFWILVALGMGMVVERNARSAADRDGAAGRVPTTSGSTARPRTQGRSSV